MVRPMKKIKTIALYTSKKEKKVLHILEQLQEIILNLGIKVIYPDASAIKIDSIIKTSPNEQVIAKSDLVIAVGGDGTLLSCSRKFGSCGLPILGINLGNLGFLNDITPSDLTNSIIEILDGKYVLEERFFLKTSINNTQCKDIALNEVVIHSGSLAQLIEFEVFVDDKFVYRQKADGLIINTPTGSTAYALSGNGPIIHPNVGAISILPMLPHSLNTRPLIVDDTVKIKVIPNKKSFISYDSQINHKLKRGDEILIQRNKEVLNLLHPLNHDFYSACRMKLGWSLAIPN